MKKLLLCLIAGAMALTMAACTAPVVDNEGENEVENNTDNEFVYDFEVETENEAEADGETLGTKLSGIFKANAADAESAEALANKIVEEAALPFSPMVMPMEEGYLAGFDNAEITGFTSCAAFAPMIGSIPFIGYVFELPEEADVEAFKTTLSENANLRWNICVTADEMVVESEGNTVFFVMCPASVEEAPADEGMAL
jgi:hypothetical protein